MIEVEFSTRITLEGDGRSADNFRNFFVTSRGRMFRTDDKGKEAKVGTITTVLVDADRAVQAGQNLWEAADASDGQLEHLVTVFYPRNGHLEIEVFPFVSQPNLLYVRDLEVEPRFRGQGIALAAIRRAIDVLAVGCEVVVLKPFPLQFVGKVNDTNKQEVSLATRKLKRLYGRMGFKNVRNTVFMALDLTHRLKDVLLESADDFEGDED